MVLEETTDLMLDVAQGVSEEIGDELEFLVLISPVHGDTRKINIASDMDLDKIILCLVGLTDHFQRLVEDDIEPEYVH